jgi:hypothetical protein
MGGQWEEVVVDDFIPCFPFAGPMFMKAKNGELWPLILAKAFAKANGGYSALITADPESLLAQLTGFPTSSLIVKKRTSQQLWEVLKLYLRSDYIVAAGKGNEAPDFVTDLNSTTVSLNEDQFLPYKDFV